VQVQAVPTSNHYTAIYSVSAQWWHVGYKKLTFIQTVYLASKGVASCFSKQLGEDVNDVFHLSLSYIQYKTYLAKIRSYTLTV
jgi:hypothetical protein